MWANNGIRSSLVIENGLETSKQGTSLPPAFFYCSRNATEPVLSDPESILASIARQLANLSPSSALLSAVVGNRLKRKSKAMRRELSISAMLET
jgi:hypothetical protein